MLYSTKKKTKNQAEVFKHAEQENHEIKQNDA